ncbi:MAG: hypothetical protein QUS14_08175 [Pyrinomonadaceae bacterium]|nr:hypothetical protein [Pyrinomonadaceae bacterium]
MRCGDNLNTTRRIRYVEPRDSGTRYVAVRRNGRRYMVPQTRYVAVRRADVEVQPRYVAVRRSPAYVDSGSRYIAVRNAPTRVKYVAVRDIDTPRYVAVRNLDTEYYAPRTNYVAVRNVDTGYRRVAVRDNYLDVVEAPAPRHVVVRSDYIDGTEEVIVPRASTIAATEYVSYPADDYASAQYVSYDNDRYLGSSNERYILTRDVYSPCMRQVAARTCPEPLSTREVQYVSRSYDDDLYDQAILDEPETTYVVDGGEYACLKRSATPMEMRSVSYAPVEYVDEPYTQEVEYVVEQPRARSVRYVADDDYIVEREPVEYVSVDDVEYVDDYDMPMAATVAYPEADSCLIANDAEAFYVSESPSTVLVELDDVETTAGLGATQRIASGFGYRDGFEDGLDAADDNDAYSPESEGDFRNGANGYEDEFGPKDIYRDEYRQAYLEGYRSGYATHGG